MLNKYIDKKKYLLENYRVIGLSELQLIILLNSLGEEFTFIIQYDKLCKVTELNAMDVTKEFLKMQEQNIVTLTGKKINMQYVEVVDVSNIFNNLKTTTSKDVYAELEMMFGRTFNNVEVNKISKWINVNNYSLDEIKSAFEKTALQGVKSLNYVKKILENDAENSENNLDPLIIEYDWLNN